MVGFSEMAMVAFNCYLVLHILQLLLCLLKLLLELLLLSAEEFLRFLLARLIQFHLLHQLVMEP